ncbi:hypothetical protein ACVIW2_008104 [Bradyrhizobium huanghuaihaiense]
MPDPFYSSKQTLERAKYHFRDFEARITAFADDKERTYSIERDANGRDNRHKIRFSQAFFDETPSVVFDFLNNLRAVLDHAIYASCMASHRNVTRFATFPFTEEATQLGNLIKGVTKEAPDEIQALIPTFKPYKGGNIALWSLHRLCNSRKHAILMPVATQDLRVYVTPGIIIGLSHRWDSEKYEIEILNSGGADFSQAHGITFRIGFNDTESWVRDSEPLGVLGAMVSEVQRVLVRIEAECRKLWPESFS